MHIGGRAKLRDGVKVVKSDFVEQHPDVVARYFAATFFRAREAENMLADIGLFSTPKANRIDQLFASGNAPAAQTYIETILARESAGGGAVLFDAQAFRRSVKMTAFCVAGRDGRVFARSPAL